MKEETRDRIGQAAAFIFTALVLVAVISVGVGSAAHKVEEPKEPSKTAPGMPLDAIQYQVPTWLPDAKQCFRVTDRQSGCKWWLIRVPGYAKDDWVVLPIEKSVS